MDCCYFSSSVFSPGSDREQKSFASYGSLLDEFKVDLVLSGHDHTYRRTGQVDENLENVPSGYQQAYDPDIGTVYVVSVSGPKMYGITKGNYAKRVAENTQLYQIINIDDKNLTYKAYEATGKFYDQLHPKKKGLSTFDLKLFQRNRK